MTALSAESERFLADIREVRDEPWGTLHAEVKKRLTAIEAAARAAERERWTVERIEAALHSRCEDEVAKVAKVDPTRMMTMHFADAHHDAAARVLAAMEAPE